MPALKDKIPGGFADPVALPQDGEQSLQWQQANRAWWESHPMRYDWNTDVGFEPLSPEFYAEIDHRFFSAVRAYMPWQRLPFDPLIDFAALRNADVLEIGVGGGSVAQLLAAHARAFTGIDLTDYAVQATSSRMRLLNLDASIRQMDAENMQFADESFDFIWSWGVIHHSSDTRRVLAEIRRVLRPGGRVVTMVYHRSFWHFYAFNGLFNGVLRGDLWKTGSLHATVQRYTDGALARYYSLREWRALVSEHLTVESLAVFGDKSGLVPLPAGALKTKVMTLVPDSLARLFLNRLRFGTYLVCTMSKP